MSMIRESQKTLDKQIVEFRGEVLRLKGEKHHLKANFKTELEKTKL